MSDRVNSNKQDLNKPLDFEVVYAAINQAYSNYQRLCYNLIVYQDNYPYCVELIQDLLTTHRTIFSNEYRNFFYMMYRCAPAVLFYLMQFHDAREIFLGKGNLVVNYRLLEKLIDTSNEYEEACEFIKNKIKAGNKSLSSYKKLIKQSQDPDYNSFGFDRLSMLDDGLIESLHDPEQDVFFQNITHGSRSLDGRTTLGREIKKYLKTEVGDFNWSDLPKPKVKRYNRTNKSNNDDQAALVSDDDLDLGSLSKLNNLKDGNVATQDMIVTKIPKKSQHAITTEQNRKQRNSIINQSHEVEDALEPQEQFFVSPMVNNNTFSVMEHLSNAPAFGPINAHRSRNYDLPGLSNFQRQPNQFLTVELKDKIESLGSLMEKERALMARQLRRLSNDFISLWEIFGSKLCLITVNPNAMGSIEQTIEELEHDCLVIHLGENLLVRPASSIMDSTDNNHNPWLDPTINENFFITTGLDLKLNLQNISLPISKRHKCFSLKQQYNIWKKSTDLNKYYEGIYRIEIKEIDKMPSVINNNTFGPYDLIYIKLQ